MSRRSYNAFIKAARKTAGLSLPSARKLYRRVSDRLGEPAKAVDIKAHPRIFKESLTKRDRTKFATLERERKEIRKARDKQRKAREEAAVSGPAIQRKIKSIADYRRALGDDLALQEDIEYASTAEY